MTRISKRFFAMAAAAVMIFTQTGMAVNAEAADEPVTTGETVELRDGDGVLDERISADRSATAEEDDTDSDPVPDKEGYILGDVNSDGRIDTTDIISLGAHIKGLKTLDDSVLICADVNSDGEINVKDISLVASHVKGIRSINWLDRLDTVSSADVVEAPKRYDLLESFNAPKQDLTFEWSVEKDVMGYVITYVKDGREEILADSDTPVSEAVLPKDLIGSAAMVTIRVKPFIYVNTEKERGVRSYKNGFEQSVYFIPDDIPSDLTLSLAPENVTLSWEAAAGATAYDVYYAAVGDSERLYGRVTVTTCEIPVQKDKDYNFRVVPVSVIKDNGTISVYASNSAAASTLVPVVTASATQGADKNKITITWPQSTNDMVDSYVIQRRTYGGDWKDLKTGIGNSTNKYVDKLTTATKYYEYRVLGVKYGRRSNAADTKYTSGWAKISVCLDPGHYLGANTNKGLSGSQGSYQYSEGTTMLELGNRLKSYLTQNGHIDVKMTRNYDLRADSFISGVRNERISGESVLTDRGKAASGYDLFVSLHSNAASNNWNETGNWQIQIYPNKTAWSDVEGDAYKIFSQWGTAVSNTMDPGGKAITDRIGEFSTALSASTRSGIIKRLYPGTKDTAYYAVLRGADSVNVPGMLIEHSFHTNPSVRQWLNDDSNLDKLAKAEANVVLRYYGFPLRY